jgi:hypothetical protein
VLVSDTCNFRFRTFLINATSLVQVWYNNACRRYGNCEHLAQVCACTPADITAACTHYLSIIIYNYRTVVRISEMYLNV